MKRLPVSTLALHLILFQNKIPVWYYAHTPKKESVPKAHTTDLWDKGPSRDDRDSTVAVNIP